MDVTTRRVRARETAYTTWGICSIMPCRWSAVWRETYAGSGAVRYSGRSSGSMSDSIDHNPRRRAWISPLPASFPSIRLADEVEKRKRTATSSVVSIGLPNRRSSA
jgi:hypothetical protein